MEEIAFESTQTMSQDAFAGWVEERSRWDPNHYELLNGRVVMNPPAGWPHGAIGSRLQYLLRAYALAHGGESFDSSQGFELPSGDTVEPDHSYISAERWAGVTPAAGKFLRAVPDLIAEVLSPATAPRDRGEKKAIYALNEVREYWLIDSKAKELRVHVLAGRAFADERILGLTDTYASPVCLGLIVPVAELFPPRLQ